VEVLRDNRGWTGEDWQAAADRLTARGLLKDAGSLTAEGEALRAHIEARTDALAVRPYGVLAPYEAALLVETLEPVTEQVLAGGVIPFPNPMGLPRR
jgi:hypothetical protein